MIKITLSVAAFVAVFLAIGRFAAPSETYDTGLARR